MQPVLGALGNTFEISVIENDVYLDQNLAISHYRTPPYRSTNDGEGWRQSRHSLGLGINVGFGAGVVAAVDSTLAAGVTASLFFVGILRMTTNVARPLRRISFPTLTSLPGGTSLVQYAQTLAFVSIRFRQNGQLRLSLKIIARLLGRVRVADGARRM